MKADGTLTDAEVRKKFGSVGAKRFTDAASLDPQTELVVGDFIRVIGYNSPGFLDSLWDTAQENAEEHTDEVLEQFKKRGVVVLLHNVQGKDLGIDAGMDRREAYVYDLEIAAFVDPPLEFIDPAWVVGAAGGAGVTIENVKGILIAIFLANVGFAIAKISIWPGEGGKMLSNGVFWISLAAIAISIAVVVKSAKAAT